MTGRQDDRQDDRQRILDEYMIDMTPEVYTLMEPDQVTKDVNFMTYFLVLLSL